MSNFLTVILICWWLPAAGLHIYLSLFLVFEIQQGHLTYGFINGRGHKFKEFWNWSLKTLASYF